MYNFYYFTPLPKLGAEHDRGDEEMHQRNMKVKEADRQEQALQEKLNALHVKNEEL